jgi:hypothetical protein
MQLAKFACEITLNALYLPMAISSCSAVIHRSLSLILNERLDWLKTQEKSVSERFSIKN